MRHYLIIILIILIIGIISCEPEQVVEVSWEKYNKIGEMPINRSEHSMAYVGNGRLIMFGGYNNNDEYLKDTWEYDLATHTWTEYNTEAQFIRRAITEKLMNFSEITSRVETKPVTIREGSRRITFLEIVQLMQKEDREMSSHELTQTLDPGRKRNIKDHLMKMCEMGFLFMSGKKPTKITP